MRLGLGVIVAAQHVLFLLIVTALEDEKTEEDRSLIHIGTKGVGRNLRPRNMVLATSIKFQFSADLTHVLGQSRRSVMVSITLPIRFFFLPLASTQSPIKGKGTVYHS